MKRNFFSGPSGVYYDSRHNEIFVLEFEGCEIMDRNFEVIGKQYKLFSSIFPTGKRLSVTGMNEEVIFLGDL